MVTSARVDRVNHNGRFTLHLPNQELAADRLLVATGRRVDLTDLGVDTVGLPTPEPSQSTNTPSGT